MIELIKELGGYLIIATGIALAFSVFFLILFLAAALMIYLNTIWGVF